MDAVECCLGRIVMITLALVDGMKLLTYRAILLVQRGLTFASSLLLRRRLEKTPASAVSDPELLSLV